MGLSSNVLKAVTVILRASQSIQVIGKKVLISSNSITYVIDKLEQKKCVRRQGCPEDRRVIYAVLTKEGKALMDHIFPQHIVEIGHVFDDLNENELNETIELLKRVGLRAKKS